VLVYIFFRKIKYCAYSIQKNGNDNSNNNDNTENDKNNDNNVNTTTSCHVCDTQ